MLRFTRRIFPAKRWVVLWHSPPVAIIRRQVNRTHSPTIGNWETGPTKNVLKPTEEKKHEILQVALQIVLKPFKQHSVLVTTTPKSLFANRPERLFANYDLVATARNVVEDLLERFLHIYVRIVSPSAAHLHKHMVISHTAETPMVIRSNYCEPQKGSRSRTPEKDNRVHLFLKENLISRTSIADDLGTVYYKHSENQESKMTRHHVVQIDESKRLSDNWRTKMQVWEKYAKYHKEFFSMLFDLHFMWDGHLGCVTTAKYHAKFLKNHAKPV